MKKRTDLTPYMPTLPATAADLKPSKALTVIDRADQSLDDPEVYDRVKSALDECNGYSSGAKKVMFARAFMAQDLIGLAKDANDEIMGNLTAEETDYAFNRALRRRGISHRQRRQQAIANQQKAIADANRVIEPPATSDIPVAFK